MSGKIHGRAEIRVDGRFFETDADASMMPGGNKNNSNPTSTRYRYNQTYLPAKVVCKVPVDSTTSVKELQEMADVEIMFISDVGRTYVIRNAAQVGDVELTGGESGGKVELTFEGDAAEELVV